MPRWTKCEASDRPYGPAPMITTSTVLRVIDFPRFSKKQVQAGPSCPVEHGLNQLLLKLEPGGLHVGCVNAIERTGPSDEIEKEGRDGTSDRRRIGATGSRQGFSEIPEVRAQPTLSAADLVVDDLGQRLAE